MLGRVICPKYLYPGSLVVDVHIDGIIVPNILIELGVAINVMTKETMQNLNLQGGDIPEVHPEGVFDDVMVSIDPWEYPTDFLVLQLKTKFNGYPLILGTPWLAIVDAYICYRARNMTINNGHLSKKLVLYPLAHSSIEHDLHLWKRRKNMKCIIQHTTQILP